MSEVIQIRDYEPKHPVKIVVRRTGGSIPVACEKPARAPCVVDFSLLRSARYRDPAAMLGWPPDAGSGEV